MEVKKGSIKKPGWEKKIGKEEELQESKAKIRTRKKAETKIQESSIH